MHWSSEDVGKEYISLVHGWMDPSVNDVHKRIRVDTENFKHTISSRSIVSDSGEPACTNVATLGHMFQSSGELSIDAEENNQEQYTLVALKLLTGRTHQIRVHMLA